MGDGVLMGADLQVTSQVLDELVSAFDGFGGRLTQACDDIRTGDGQVTGDDPLAGRVHDFAGELALRADAAGAARARVREDAPAGGVDVRCAGS